MFVCLSCVRGCENKQNKHTMPKNDKTFSAVINKTKSSTLTKNSEFYKSCRCGQSREHITKPLFSPCLSKYCCGHQCICHLSFQLMEGKTLLLDVNSTLLCSVRWILSEFEALTSDINNDVLTRKTEEIGGK